MLLYDLFQKSLQCQDMNNYYNVTLPQSLSLSLSLSLSHANFQDQPLHMH